MSVQKEDKPHYLGHRKRLKEKFLKDEGRSMPDYELLELLLTYAIPRKDVKADAKELIKDFSGLPEILSSSQEKLFEHKLSLSTVSLIKLIFVLSVQMGWKRLREADNIIFKEFDYLADYCRTNLAGLDVEEFHVLFLNSSLELIKDEKMQKGSVDCVAIYPREIAKKALAYNAVKVILYHNHPGGRCAPSKQDTDLTQETIAALKSVNIDVEDHIIVTKNDVYSFRAQNLLFVLKKKVDRFYDLTVLS